MDYLTRIKPIPKEEQCENNSWVKCLDKTQCKKCGWNPEIAEKRIQSHGKQEKEN